MAADIDVRAISTFSSLPEATISTLSENPTIELVKLLLQNIEKKAKEYEQSKSQKVKLEVELETVVRTSESRTKVLQNSRDKALNDVSKLREDLQKAENARARAESDLEGMRQSTSNEATELVNLRARISSLEASNRDTLSLLDSKSSAYDRLSQELSTQHQKLVDLRKQVSALEQANQEAASAVTSAKFKQTSLAQELELQKKNIDWYETERKIKADEHQNFRKEKNARVTELQRSNESYIEQAESLRRSEASIKHQLENQIKKNDDLITELEKLREEHVTDNENHRMEVENISRLAQLQQASAETAKQRVHELSNALEEAKEDASDEIGRIRAEIQNEHNDREAAEQRVAELEARISELEAEVQQQPTTPRKDINGANLSTPQRPGTPSGSFTPRSISRTKQNMSVTQLYSAYTQLESDLDRERRANEQLQTHVNSMLEDLEANKPEIEELRSDQTRLQSEVFEMSTLAEQANHERDAAVKEARLVQGQLEALNKQLLDAQQALRDRNSQLRRLLLEQRVGTISDFDYERLRQEAAAADQRDMEHLSETQQGVNRYLIAFKNIEELQTINENQLTTIRNLAAKLESEQAQERQQRFQQMEQELEEARAQIVSYQDEVKSMVAQSKSFVKERDMFRSMLTRRGHGSGPIDPADFSRSMPLAFGGVPARDTADGSAGGPEADYGRALRELQVNFDNYRQETSTDTASLRKQVSELSQRNNQLQLDASRAQGQLTAANQRYEMIQANFNMLRTENTEIQKRSWTAMESATKQELKMQETAEQLVAARGMVESLQRESANLKAEKDLWKNVEKRLVDDNETLRNERSRLDQLNANLQSLLNEREHSESEMRRRLQSQAESLETELQSAKRKLEEEIEETKKSALRREYEHEQSQKRIDDLVTSMGNTREELAAAKSTRDHLQARVDEMTVELHSAEERLAVFSRPATDPAHQTNGADEVSISHEQELVVEVSELKRDLEIKTSDLAKAHDQIETFKGISQEAEDRLQEFMETNDQFKAESEANLAEKDAKIKDLEQRIEDISSELSTTNSELSKLRDAQAESDRRLSEQKTVLESEIARLKESEEKALEQATFNLEASKAQAQIATDAQQNYETELVKHADAAKHLQVVRSETNQLRLDLAEAKSKSQNALHDLEQKETSWAEMESRFKQEIEDLKRRREELIQQNGILHVQLEQLTQQITAVQRDRAATAEADGSSSGDTSSPDLTNLQEVIRYLRREKEIVEVQYHLSTQEAKRLKQQYDFAQSQLDETRLKLDQQRRTEVDLERSAMSHNKLMETLNELNLYRESSVTLRNDLRQNQQVVAEKSKKVEELEAQLQPLQERVAELENLCELREGEMKLLQDDRDHWQQRTQNILSKYDRVDPAELESLKTRISGLESERDEAISVRDTLQAQVDAHPEALEAARNELRTRLSDQFKTRSRELSGRIKEKQAELDVALAEKASLEMELESVKKELETVKGNAIAVSGSPETQQGSQLRDNLASTSDQTSRITELETKIAELNSTIVSKDEELSNANSSRDESFKARETQLKEVLNKRLAEVKKEAEVAKTAALEELRQSLESQHRQEIESLRAQEVPVSAEIQQGTEDQPSPAAGTDAAFDQFMASISVAQAKLLVQKNETINNMVKTNIKRHVEKEKEALRQQLASEQPSASKDDVSAQVEEIEKKFAEERQRILDQKDEEFAAEKASLIQQHEADLEEAKRLVREEQQQKIEDLDKAKNLIQGKVSMYQTQAKTAQAKIAVVRNAAEETPEKAVKDVWEVAKSAKPTDSVKAADTLPSAGVSTEQSKPAAAEEPKAESAPETNGDVAKVESTHTETNESTAKRAQPNTGAPASGIRRPSVSALPQPARGALQAGRGRGAAQGSGARGTGIPRGAARGGRASISGRGGAQAAPVNATQTAAGRGSGSASPSRGGALNPGAQQFTPGNKRAREDSEGGNVDGNQGKRIRGGGAGS